MAICPRCAQEIPQNATFFPACQAEGGRTIGLAAPAPPRGRPKPKGVADLVAFGLLVTISLVITVVAPAIVNLFQGSPHRPRPETVTNLRNIGLAVENYHGADGPFPAGGIKDESGRQSQSWQTMLLPYLDQVPLYNQIDFDRAWDDPANRVPHSVVIPSFRHSKQSQQTLPSGYGISHYAASSRIFSENSALRLSDITDGRSTTILGGEVTGNLKAWADPTNFRDPALGINARPDSFGSPFPDGAPMLMMDGRVLGLSSNIDPQVLKALASPAGGEIVGDDDF